MSRQLAGEAALQEPEGASDRDHPRTRHCDERQAPRGPRPEHSMSSVESAAKCSPLSASEARDSVNVGAREPRELVSHFESPKFLVSDRVMPEVPSSKMW